MQPAKPEFEIHFAAEPSTSGRHLRKRLLDIGFEDDALVFPGVVFPNSEQRGITSCPILDVHLTWSSYVRQEYHSQIALFRRLLDGHAEGVDGYAHAEVIRPEWDVDLAWSEFRPAVSPPFTPMKAEWNENPKTWDIHLSLRRSTLEPQLEDILHERLGFHFIDLKKKTGDHRIFTMQGATDIPEARSFFFAVVDWLREVGGAEGSIKFEQTIFWQVVGKPDCLPPQLVGSASDYMARQPDTAEAG